MISRLALQILIGMLTTLFLSLLFWLNVWRQAKFSAPQGGSSSIAKWIVAHRWSVTGFIFGAAMYMGAVATPVIADVFHSKGLRMEQLLIGIPIWTLGGLFFGWAMSLSMRKRQKKSVIGRDPSA